MPTIPKHATIMCRVTVKATIRLGTFKHTFLGQDQLAVPVEGEDSRHQGIPSASLGAQYAHAHVCNILIIMTTLHTCLKDTAAASGSEASVWAKIVT